MMMMSLMMMMNLGMDAFRIELENQLLICIIGDYDHYYSMIN